MLKQLVFHFITCCSFTFGASAGVGDRAFEQGSEYFARGEVSKAALAFFEAAKLNHFEALYFLAVAAALHPMDAEIPEFEAQYCDLVVDHAKEGSYLASFGLAICWEDHIHESVTSALNLTLPGASNAILILAESGHDDMGLLAVWSQAPSASVLWCSFLQSLQQVRDGRKPKLMMDMLSVAIEPEIHRQYIEHLGMAAFLLMNEETLLEFLDSEFQELTEAKPCP